MAKRFIDTNIWNKAWFRKLDTKSKLIWIYILTKCDHAGIFDADYEAMNFYIGTDLEDFKDIPIAIREKMQPIEDNQFFIPSFIEYQYGTLRINSKPHLSVIKRLEDKGLNNYLQRVMLTPKDKDKEEVIDKRQDKFIDKVNKVIKEKKYSNEETDNFVGFWTERNTSNTKMRFELQQTFDIARRLATWVRNNKEWKIKNKKETNERTKMQFEAS
jgi:hypothetical protein|tara:strand:+ start:2185 stop:2829 length:645 start_codon:yes stop_codon:yes gene_type:complete